MTCEEQLEIVLSYDDIVKSLSTRRMVEYYMEAELEDKQFVTYLDEYFKGIRESNL